MQTSRPIAIAARRAGVIEAESVARTIIGAPPHGASPAVSPRDRPGPSWLSGRRHALPGRRRRKDAKTSDTTTRDPAQAEPASGLRRRPHHKGTRGTKVDTK